MAERPARSTMRQAAHPCGRCTFLALQAFMTISALDLFKIGVVASVLVEGVDG